MATPNPCPRCSAPRLTIIYYDGDGNVIGGRLECTDCGPRQAEELVPAGGGDVHAQLLKRKAS
jgi:hypothetical protein